MTREEQLMRMAECDKCYGAKDGKCFLNDRVFCSDWVEAEKLYEQGHRVLDEKQIELLGEKE